MNGLFRALIVIGGIISIIAGAYLNYIGKADWGWFLFTGFLALLWSARIAASESDKKKEE